MATRLGLHGLPLNGAAADLPAEKPPRQWLLGNVAGSGPAEWAILVGDRFGKVIGQLDANMVGVAWKLSDYGQARMVIPQTNATATERMVQFGNRVLIQFNNGLPDWGGVIQTPRKWAGGGIEVVAYSGEHLLMDRVTDRGRYFSEATAGEIFRAVLTEMEPVGVEIGSVWEGVTLHSPDYHFRTIYDIVKNSLAGRMESADWAVEAGLRGGMIGFVANYYDRRGTNHGRGVALLDGVNITLPKLDEQGTLVNEWFLAGNGTGWGAENRLYATSYDGNSVTKYGLAQRGETRVDITTQATLNQAALLAVIESSEPRPVVSFDALDREPARWGQYDVGDTVWLELYSAGFDGLGTPVRVKAREFLAGSGVCSLVVE